MLSFSLSQIPVLFLHCQLSLLPTSHRITLGWGANRTDISPYQFKNVIISCCLMVAELVTIFCGSLAQSKYLDKSQQRFVFLIIKNSLNTLDELAVAFAIYWFPIHNHFPFSKLKGFFFSSKHAIFFLKVPTFNWYRLHK